MARPIKIGLNYFPFDVDIFDDPKFLHIENKYGVKGEIITIKLLCWIYRDGYSCEWNDDTALIFAKKNFSSIGANLCKEVVAELIKREFFNERLFESFGILTSRAIQERWQTIMINSKRKTRVNSCFSLVSSEETPLIKELTTVKTELSTQSKVKESKVKKSKEEENIKTALAFLQKNAHSDLEVFSMQNKKNVKDWTMMLETFNDQIDLEVAQNKISFNKSELMPRLRKWCRSWINNQSNRKTKKATVGFSTNR